ncbi:sigma-70 family RNA polymerase sigma factor [Rhizomonospora bruguierae]|uniref:sigma-70 family RNA polymerase sigma factor n=1 Tax=Rhizomonospora bruguierae TaxID=1581705 RepID=UPI001BCF45F1|nr:sigma-70 family RNA polymerase sigma factor [Micromonospora sp. NBRC 107566]
MTGVDDFDEFYRGSRQRLLGYVYALTGDLAEAQDAVQEAFIRAWQRWGTISRYEEPEAWVRVVAARVAVSRWRSVRSRVRAYLRHGPAADVAGPDTQLLEVVEALRLLPDEQRLAIALHYLMGMPVAEVAQQTRVPVGTVKSRLARGRLALAGVLGPEPEEAADA